MGDVNQLAFIRQQLGEFHGPFLEVGSRNYGNTQDVRSLLAGRGEYVGLDMSAGDGVDCVLDMTCDFAAIDEALSGRRFGTIFCLSVLEHCDQPFRMAENLTRLLEADGTLCVSVPFAWQFHGYPSDYWRFTHEGVRKLFPDLEFADEQAAAVSSQPGDFRKLGHDVGKIPIAGSYHRKQGRWLRGASAGMFRLLGKIGLFRWLTGYRYVMAPTMITMIGRRRTAQQRAA